MASTYIPGAATLGYGFDVMGSYDEKSKTRALFEISYRKKTFQDYLVPENASVDPKRITMGGSTFVNSRRKMENFFSAAANVGATYGFFSGQFDASYSMTNKSDVEYQFGIVQSYQKLYRLELDDRSPEALADWVKEDAVYKEVPDKFTDADRALFFRFFEKYGLYYVRGIYAGSRLYYNASVRKSYGYSEQKAEAKLKLEYTALFTAGAESTWKEVGEKWASERQVSIAAEGGDSSMLNMLMPGYGTSQADLYKTWLNSAEANPSVIDFVLAPIAELFPDIKAEAVKKAADSYVNHKLFLESKTGTCLLHLDREDLQPPPSDDFRTLGYQLAAIDRRGMKPVFARSYSTSDFWGDYEKLYATMLLDIQPYNNDNHIIAFTAFSNFAQNAPTKPFCEFLMNCGAGIKLNQWLDTKESNRGIYSCCTLTHCNYCFVGIPGGEKPGFEAFSRAGGCDTGGTHWSYLDSWLDQPARPVSLIVDLYELLKGPELVAHIGRVR